MKFESASGGPWSEHERYKDWDMEEKHIPPTRQVLLYFSKRECANGCLSTRWYKRWISFWFAFWKSRKHIYIKWFCRARASLMQNWSLLIHHPLSPFSPPRSSPCFPTFLKFCFTLTPPTQDVTCITALVYSGLGQFLHPSSVSQLSGEVLENVHILFPNLPSCCP